MVIRTFSPLLNLETLCSWFFKHFLASCIAVFHGVWPGFVPELVPRFRQPSKRRAILGVEGGGQFVFAILGERKSQVHNLNAEGVCAGCELDKPRYGRHGQGW